MHGKTVLNRIGFHRLGIARIIFALRVSSHESPLHLREAACSLTGTEHHKGPDPPWVFPAVREQSRVVERARERFKSDAILGSGSFHFSI
jgi:hypothetical protein